MLFQNHMPFFLPLNTGGKSWRNESEWGLGLQNGKKHNKSIKDSMIQIFQHSGCHLTAKRSWFENNLHDSALVFNTRKKAFEQTWVNDEWIIVFWVNCHFNLNPNLSQHLALFPTLPSLLQAFTAFPCMNLKYNTVVHLYYRWENGTDGYCNLTGGASPDTSKTAPALLPQSFYWLGEHNLLILSDIVGLYEQKPALDSLPPNICTQ